MAACNEGKPMPSKPSPKLKPSEYKKKADANKKKKNAAEKKRVNEIERKLRYLKKVGVVSPIYPDKENKLSRGQKSYLTKLINGTLIAMVLRENQRYVAYKCRSKAFIALLIESGFENYLIAGVLFIHCGVDDRVYVDEKNGEIRIREQYGKKTKRLLTFKLGTRNDFIFDEAEGYESNADLRELEPGESVGRNMPPNPGYNRWAIYNSRYSYEELLEEVNRYIAIEDEDSKWCLVFEFGNYTRNRTEEIAAEKAAKGKALRMKKNLFARTHQHKE